MDDRNHNPNTPTPQKNENRVDDQIRNGGARHELSWRFIKSENSPQVSSDLSWDNLPFILSAFHYLSSQPLITSIL